MANRFWSRNAKSLLMGRCTIMGSFAPNGSSAVSSASVKGKGFTVARTSTGLFTITFNDKYNKLVAGTAHLQMASADGTKAQIGTYTAASKTLQIRCIKPATAAGTGTAALSTATIPVALDQAKIITTNDISVVADATNTGSGGVLGLDSFPALARVNGATDPSLKLTWAATKVNEVQLPSICLLDRASDSNVTVTINGKRDGTTDAAIKVDVKAFNGKGDTNFGSKTGAITTETNYAVTLLAADLDNSKPLYLSLIPEGNANDALVVYSITVAYTRETKVVSGIAAVNTDAVADVAANANNIIHFICEFSDSQVD